MDPVNGTSSGASQSGSTSRMSELTSDQFLKIMFSELTRQDPLKPNDSNALLQQMSSIRTIEANLALERKLDTLVAQNQLSNAGGLIGAFVSGLSETNARTEGQVVSISQTKDGVVLNLANGQRVPMKSVDEIFVPDLNQPNPNNPNPNPTTPAAEIPNAPGGQTTDTNNIITRNNTARSTLEQLLRAIGGTTTPSPSSSPSPTTPTTTPIGEVPVGSGSSLDSPR